MFIINLEYNSRKKALKKTFVYEQGCRNFCQVLVQLLKLKIKTNSDHVCVWFWFGFFLSKSTPQKLIVRRVPVCLSWLVGCWWSSSLLTKLEKKSLTAPLKVLPHQWLSASLGFKAEINHVFVYSLCLKPRWGILSMGVPLSFINWYRFLTNTLSSLSDWPGLDSSALPLVSSELAISRLN